MNDLRLQINNNLEAFFDTDDETYKLFFSDKLAEYPTIINKPTDLEIGFTASIWEYTRILSKNLVNQLFWEKSDDKFLRIFLENYFSTPRLEGESNSDWIERVIVKVLRPKVSKASIINALRPFSSQEPKVENSVSGGMFAGFSFASRYTSYFGDFNGEEKKVFPAIAQSSDFSIFSITVTLYDTATNDILSAIDTIEETIAAGITYRLQILSTVESLLLLDGNNRVITDALGRMLVILRYKRIEND